MSVIASMIAMIGKKKKAAVGPVDPNEVYSTDVLGPWTFRRGLSDYNNSFGRQTPKQAKEVNGKLFILGQLGALMVSDDGETFTKVVSLSNAGWPGVAIMDIDYSPEQGLYVVVGSGYVAKSQNLVDWEFTQAPVFAAANSLFTSFNHVLWKGGKWTLAISSSNKTVITTDFVNFSVSSYTLAYPCVQAHKMANGIRFMGNYGLTEVSDAGVVTGQGAWSTTVWPLVKFAGTETNWIGANGTNGLQSIQGANNGSDLGAMSKFQNIYIIDNIYFFPGTDAKIYRTANVIMGSTYTPINLALTEFGNNPISCIVKFKGKYIAIGAGRAISSPDLATWGSLIDFSNMDNSFGSANVLQLDSNGMELIAVGQYASYSKSLDAVDWEFSAGLRSLLGQNAVIERIVRNGNTIIVQPSSGAWLRSTDAGVNWTSLPQPYNGLGGDAQLLLKMATKYAAFNKNNDTPMDVKSTDLNGTSWTAGAGPYNRLWGALGGTGNGRRSIAGAAYGGQILTLVTNYGYVLTSGNEGASYDYAGVINTLSASGLSCADWVGSGTAFGDGYHLYGHADGSYSWWKLGSGLGTSVALKNDANWGPNAITAVAYANGWYYFGGAHGKIARTPLLTTPSFEIFDLPAAWQKQPIRDIVVHAGQIVVCGAQGKLATAQLQ